MTGTDQTTRKIARRWPLIGGLVVLALVLLLGGIVTLRGTTGFEVDTEWMAEIVEHRSPFWEVPALVMNYLGGGVIGTFVVPIGITVALCLFRRFWAASFYLAATVASAGLVQILKNVFGRARPEDILVHADFGSFPSGHTANAATMAVALAIIFARTWIWVVGSIYVVLMMLSRTYLGAHWVTDTIGGLLLGVGVAILVWIPLANKLFREDEGPHTFVLSRRTS